MTLCSICGLHFSGTAAFDLHRVGVHAYTFREGMRREPPVDDGRRCLAPDEMAGAGLKLEGGGRWTRMASDDDLARLRVLEQARLWTNESDVSTLGTAA